MEREGDVGFALATREERPRREIALARRHHEVVGGEPEQPVVGDRRAEQRLVVPDQHAMPRLGLRPRDLGEAVQELGRQARGGGLERRAPLHVLAAGGGQELGRLDDAADEARPPGEQLAGVVVDEHAAHEHGHAAVVARACGSVSAGPSGDSGSPNTRPDAMSTHEQSTDAGMSAPQTCIALSSCCATLPASQRGPCTTAAMSGNTDTCANYLGGLQGVGTCATDAGRIMGPDAASADAGPVLPTDAGAVLPNGMDAAVSSNPPGDASVDVIGADTGPKDSGLSDSGPFALDAYTSPIDSGALASFVFSLGGKTQSPLNCPSQAWEFSGMGSTAILTNTGTSPIAYITETNTWYGGAQYIPDVPTGTPGELVGVIAPGGQVNISGFTSYVLLGSSLPFSVQGAHTI